MKIKNTTIYRLTLYAALTGQMCILFGLPMRINGLVSFGVACIAATNIMAFATVLFEHYHCSTDVYHIVYICLLAIMCLISLIFTSALSTANITKLTTFLQLPIYFLIAERLKRTQIREIIYRINLLYPFMFLFFYNTGFSHRFVGQYGETVHPHITLGYGNPNEAGLYLMLCAFILLSAVFHYKSRMMKILCLGEISFCCYLLTAADCRITVVLYTAVAIAVLLCKKVSFSRAAMNVILLTPLFFVVLILAFPMLENITFLGSSFDTGRSILYREIIENLTFPSALFGDFKRYALSNMHNAYISIFASLGILPMVTFWGVLYMALKKCQNVVIEKKEHMVLLFSLLAIVVYSAVEAALLVSGSVYAASVFLLYYLYISNDEIALKGMR